MTGYGRRHWRQKIRTSSAAAWPPQHARCRWDTPCSTCLASYGSLAALCSMLLALSLRSTSCSFHRATSMCWVAFPGNRRTCHIDVPATAAGFCHTTPRKFSHGLVSCTRHEVASVGTCDFSCEAAGRPSWGQRRRRRWMPAPTSRHPPAA